MNIEVNNMDIQEILAKAFDIGNKTSFEVRFFIENEFRETKVMTYTELGMTLIKNCNDIDFVSINQKKNN